MRWASCDNALYTFVSAFRVVVSALEYLEADGDGKALNYLLQRFDLIHRHIGNKWAYTPKPASSNTFLQAKLCNFVETAKESGTVISQLQ